MPGARPVVVLSEGAGAGEASSALGRFGVVVGAPGTVGEVGPPGRPGPVVDGLVVVGLAGLAPPWLPAFGASVMLPDRTKTANVTMTAFIIANLLECPALSTVCFFRCSQGFHGFPPDFWDGHNGDYGNVKAQSRQRGALPEEDRDNVSDCCC